MPMPTITGALSIPSHPPDGFKIRIMGFLPNDGFHSALLAALEQVVKAESGLLRFVAPRIGGVLQH